MPSRVAYRRWRPRKQGSVPEEDCDANAERASHRALLPFPRSRGCAGLRGRCAKRRVRTTIEVLKSAVSCRTSARRGVMNSAPRDDITGWLRAWSNGDETALERLTPLVYGELHRRARRLMGRERDGHSLQPTELIHEAYLRLVGSTPVDWHDRSHFYALAARLMRQILVDHARSRGRQKRGGAALPVTLDEAAMCPRNRRISAGSTTRCMRSPIPTCERVASSNSVSSEDSASTRWLTSSTSPRRRCSATGGLPRPGCNGR